MGVAQWVLIGVVVLLLIAYPLLMSRKNKQANEKMIEQTNSLKRGDEILTTSGVYGKILEVKQDGEAKKVVIETGSGKNVSYMTIDAYSIYTVFGKEPPVKVEDKKEESKKIEDKPVVKETKKAVEVKIESDKDVKAETSKESKEKIVKSEKTVEKTNKPAAKKSAKKD